MTQNKIYKKTYEYNKPYQYKWVQENKELVNEIKRRWARKNAYWKQTQKIYLNILLEE